MRTLLLLFFGLMLNGCGLDLKDSSLSRDQRLMVDGRVPDFSVNVLKSYSKKPDPTDCRSHIEDIVCLVDPGPEDIPQHDERPCLEGSDAYAEPFQKLYDNYPPALQKMFCSLDKIFIEKKFFGTAYGGIIVDESGNAVGAKMGIRQSVLDENLSLKTWASWKEQLNFGGIKDSYDLTEGLPVHIPTVDARVSDFLYFVVAHEFGHVFDFANDLNKTDSTCVGEECPFADGSWGELSWESETKAKGDNEFAFRKDLCFYSCEFRAIDLENVPQLYRGLQKSTFISTYAATQAWDDFADSLAYFAMDYYLQPTYTLDTKQDAAYDVIGKLKSEKFKEKRKYIQNFLSGAIRYP